MNNNYIIDIHNDIAANVIEATQKDITQRHTLYEGTPQVPGLVAHNNVDLPRLREGNVKMVFATIFGLDQASFDELVALEQDEYNFEKLKQIKFGLAAARDQMEYYQTIFQHHPDQVVPIRAFDEYEELLNTPQIGMLLHLEGIDFVDRELQLLGEFYRAGVRSVALTWRNRNLFGGGNNVAGGLTDLGAKIIHRIEELGMIFDLAHANQATFWDAMEVITNPPIVSHALCEGICPNSRNLTDTQICAVVEKGGVIGLAAIPDYIGGDQLDDYVNHFEYVINLVGDDHVGFGTDFDGLVDPIDRFMDGFTGSDGFPNVITIFKQRGWSVDTISKISHRNIERIMQQVLPPAVD